MDSTSRITSGLLNHNNDEVRVQHTHIYYLRHASLTCCYDGQVWFNNLMSLGLYQPLTNASVTLPASLAALVAPGVAAYKPFSCKLMH
jgi:hypothetical protein